MLQILQRGGKPSVTYGHRVMGLPPVLLKRLQLETARALPSKRGNSALKLAVYQPGPALVIRSDPISYWASRVWEEGAPSEHVEEARRRACRDQVSATLE